MGTPVVPGEKGDDCLLMYPAGQTPKYLLLNIWGMTKDPVWIFDPPNGEHVLTQSPILPCLWVKTWDDFEIYYAVNAGGSTLEGDHKGWVFFFDWKVTPGWEYFANQMLYSNPPKDPVGGSAFIDLYDFPGRAYQQAHDFGLMPTAYTRFDALPCPNDPTYVNVRRFGNVRTPTNIAIKFDATHYDQWETFEKES